MNTEAYATSAVCYALIGEIYFAAAFLRLAVDLRIDFLAVFLRLVFLEDLAAFLFVAMTYILLDLDT